MAFTDRPRAVKLKCEEPTLTEQAHLASCDIRNIMGKYERTGVLEHTKQYEGTYGDFLNVPDFQEAQNHLAATRSMFESIPSSIREQFDNDPAQFVEFMTDENNREHISDLGLSTNHLPEPKKVVEPTTPPAGDNKKTDSKADETSK